MENMKNEIFKNIPGFDDYQVSNFGRVKSFKYIKERILKPADNGHGYYFVTLSKNKKMKKMYIHQLVAIVFLNHTLDGTNKIVVDHINENKLDNRVKNLQLISNRENIVKSKLLNDSYSSNYTGVSWCKTNKKWQVHIIIDKKIVYT